MNRPAPARANVLRVVTHPLFWAAVVALMFTVPLVRTLAIAPPPKLPVLAQIPPFELTDQAGGRFASEQQLRGKVWVASFIFTRCPTICPLITEKMAKVQHRSRNLGQRFHMVSFSVDPEHDTPEVLVEYAREHHANGVRWSFLTGPFDVVARTVEKGLKVAMGRERSDDEPPNITHSTHFVLVDANMRIRGFYDSAEPGNLDRLLSDAGLLVNRGD